MLIIPEDFELLEFFESEPVECESSYMYRFTDQNGVTLLFSFNDIESSIQASLSLQDNIIARYSQECAKEMTIENDTSGRYIRCLFEFDDVSSDIKIYVSPFISVQLTALSFKE